MSSSGVVDIDAFLPSSLNLLHVFFGVIVIVYLFESYLDIRQHFKYQIHQKPKQLTYIDDSQFHKAQAYGLDKSLFGFLTSFISTSRLCLFLYYSIYPSLWSFSSSVSSMIFSPILSESTYSNWSILLTSLLFFLLDHLVELFCDLPFTLYSTFIIEEKHGFNKQTLSLFISDQIKSIFLMILIGLPILGIFLIVIDLGGPYFYMYISLLTVVIQLLATIIYPTLIQPLFNKVINLPDGELKNQIESLASRCKFPLRHLYKIDGSKRSAHSNAYFYGFFKNKRIVLYDTLIDQCTIPQVVGVLAHEIGHWVRNHTVKLLIFGMFRTTLTFFLFGHVVHSNKLYHDFGFNEIRATFIGLKLFLFIILPLHHIINFIGNIISRIFEFQADEYSCQLGYAKELSEGLIVLQKENKSTMISDPLYAAYHYSHPPVLQRLEKIHKYLDKHSTKTK